MVHIIVKLMICEQNDVVEFTEKVALFTDFAVSFSWCI
jgi:hypothetical protein